MISGILIIDKPAGWTSHDVVGKLRSITRQKRIGHGGTLDPMATGVLPVFIGRATRAAEFSENSDKEYIAGLRFGIVTDTQDITGNILSERSVTVDAGELKDVLQRFLGPQKQTPPMYSAVKQDGKKLYELARRGIEVERAARDIEISAIDLIGKPLQADDTGSDAFLRVACSKGTYIRTLCHDIGTVLGCGATLTYLRRTKAGAFTIDMAHTFDDIDLIAANHIIPVEVMFSQYPSVHLNDFDTRKAKNGALRIIRDVADGKYRVYAPGGEFLLFGEVTSGRLKTIKSFFEV